MRMNTRTLMIVTVVLGGSLVALNSSCCPEFYCWGRLETCVAFDMLVVGNPGNEHGERGFGGVDYTFKIAKYEVTAGQYTKFLNAVAATDTYGLYDPQMWSDEEGCKIERTGEPGSYTYSIAEDWADRPVNCIGWGDAARFANWLHNGMPVGEQDLTTTEDGSYFMNGAGYQEMLSVMRESDATWVIPTENEWFKAAYHKNDGVTGNYYEYPTRSDIGPSQELDLGGNNATYVDSVHGPTIGAPYYRTEVGAHKNSPGPYGTFDMGGNVWEWNEAVTSWSYIEGDSGTSRGIRGGGYLNVSSRTLQSRYRSIFGDDGESTRRFVNGFRIAKVR